MKLLKNFPIESGNHCSSTSLSEISRYYNHNLSEALVFGISSGLDFVYYEHYLLDHSKLIFSRNPVMEHDFFENLGLDFKWHYGERFNWNEVKEYLDQDVPVLFLTDPFYLEFFNVKVNSVAGHTLTLIGYNEKENELYISDSIGDKIFKCSFESFYKSINNKKPPFYQSNIWSPVPYFNINEPLPIILERAIIRNAKEMINSNSSHRGIRAINKLGNEIKEWNELPKWEDMCTNIYRSLELIGTGGSGFRKLYIQFLTESSEILPWLKEGELIDKMYRLERTYRKLSRKCYTAPKKGETVLLEISAILFELEKLETDFWSQVINIYNQYHRELV